MYVAPRLLEGSLTVPPRVSAGSRLPGIHCESVHKKEDGGLLDLARGEGCWT